MNIKSLIIEAHPSEEHSLTIVKEKLIINKDEIVFERIPNNDFFAEPVYWSIKSKMFVSMVNTYIDKSIAVIMSGKIIVSSTSMPTYKVTLNYDNNSTDIVIYHGFNRGVLNLFRIIDRGFDEVLRGKLINYHRYEK